VTDPNSEPMCWTECEPYDQPISDPPSAS